MIYIDKPCSHIRHDPFSGCAVLVCKGYFLESEYREALNRCLDLMHQTKAKHLIVNLQAAKNECWAENAWTATEWFPRLVQTELTRLAIVVADKPLPSGFVFQADSDRCIASRCFDLMEDAYAWMSPENH